MQVHSTSSRALRSGALALIGCTLLACDADHAVATAAANSAGSRADVAPSDGLAHRSWPQRSAQPLGMPLVAASPNASPGAHTLVLYDTSGDYGFLGELNAAALGTLLSHFGTWDAAPVASYASGTLSRYDAVVYHGSTSDEVLPPAFLSDVARAHTPLLWIDENLDELVQSVPDFARTRGFAPQAQDTAPIAEVSYKGVSFTRDATNPNGITQLTALTAPAVSLATALHADGTRVPWAVRSGDFYYLAEDPLGFISSSDRYLVLCDLLFELLAPDTPERHRALVRIEDVSAQSDPQNLRQLADYLASRNVPFSVATIPRYEDPLGVYNAGQAFSQELRENAALVDALDYMAALGGKLIMHGYTHQYSNLQNPYSGVSADDFEFYRVHWGDQQEAVYDGPVPEDSQPWAAERLQRGLDAFASAGLLRPDVFEWPHYWGSEPATRALAQSFSRVYQHVVFFTGILSKAPVRYDQNIEIYLPYAARDPRGFELIPENLDHYTPDSGPDRTRRTADDILADARLNLAVRDGFASFFFHNYFSAAELAPIIEGIQALGYEFVSIDAVHP